MSQRLEKNNTEVITPIHWSILGTACHGHDQFSTAWANSRSVLEWYRSMPDCYARFLWSEIISISIIIRNWLPQWWIFCHEFRLILICENLSWHRKGMFHFVQFSEQTAITAHRSSPSYYWSQQSGFHLDWKKWVSLFIFLSTFLLIVSSTFW